MLRVNKMALKPWWQIAVPEKNIRKGEIDESIFVAKRSSFAKAIVPLPCAPMEILLLLKSFRYSIGFWLLR